MTDKTYPYPDNPGQTHWQGCWRCVGHHNCAVAAVDKLREAIAEFFTSRSFFEMMNDEGVDKLFVAWEASAPKEAKDEV